MQQTSFKFEILIYDDASTDTTSEIIKDYQKRYPDLIFPVLETENKYSKGVRGMNFIYNFPRAKGKYIALCEGDDYWISPDKLQRQVQFMEENKEVYLTFHNFRKRKGNELTDPFPYPDRFKNGPYVLGFKETFQVQIQTLTMVFRNEINKPKGLNVLNGDALLIALSVEKGKVAFLDFDGAVYRLHPGGVHAGKSKYIRMMNSMASRKKMIPAFKQPIKGQLYSKTAYFYKEMAKLDFKFGNYFKGLSNLLQMLKFNLLYVFSKPIGNS
ncbi:putative glycosyltransferase - possibly involved in cell wall localization and side chain formation of rhamnose-glucose polysaccharide [Cyclobacterium qasimii M12-11B]|nr:putative glycosyltransferase - possibly involved in cell wall localization and side chain formation of rhamnose-glucose polysaccharide [Cyclobacterium qasimii M12-11B]